MRIRLWWAALGLAAASCSSSQPDCSPATCSGCCRESICQPGTANDTCGINGNACDSCVGAQACTAGSCLSGAGGGTAGGSGGGGSSMSDPCMGIPTTGRCFNPMTIQYCAAVSGNTTPSVQSYSCAAGTTCALVDAGFQTVAECKLNGACIPGMTQCLGSAQLQTCSSGGAWTNSACPGACVNSGTGAFCRPASATGTLSGKLAYEARGPNANYPTDWSATKFSAAAQGFLAISYTQCNTTCQLVDAKVTDSQGAYTVSVAGAVDAGDVLAFAAIAFSADGGVAYMVADPQVDAGVQLVGSTPNPRVWSWAIATGAVTPGGTITIQETGGSGAARVYDYLRYSYAHAATEYGGRAGVPLVIWLGYGTSWNCGSCFGLAPTTAFGAQFQSQMWLNGSLSAQEYWSDAVTAHELGHWVMASFGFPGIEGGQHCLGWPDPPGMAWSEGFATWHSSDVRNNPVYYDKQSGSMFYLDLAARSYSPGHNAWSRPAPAAGLLQDLDENELAAMLWSLSNSSPGADASLFSALASPRMTTRMLAALLGNQANLRGYTQHTWSSACPIAGRQDLAHPIPALPDFLDALVCGGFSTGAVNAATNPTTAYPYPTASPLCQ